MTFQTKRDHTNRHNDGFAFIPWQPPRSHQCTTISNTDLDLDHSNRGTFEIVTKDGLGQWKRKSHPCCRDIEESTFRKPLMRYIIGFVQLVSNDDEDDDNDGMSHLVFDEFSAISDVTFVDDIPPPPPPTTTTITQVYYPTTLERHECQWVYRNESLPPPCQVLHHHNAIYSESPVLDICWDGTIKLINEETGSGVLRKIDLTYYLPSDLINAIQGNDDNDGEIATTTTTTPLRPILFQTPNQGAPFTNDDSLLCCFSKKILNGTTEIWS